MLLRTPGQTPCLARLTGFLLLLLFASTQACTPPPSTEPSVEKQTSEPGVRKEKTDGEPSRETPNSPDETIVTDASEPNADSGDASEPGEPSREQVQDASPDEPVQEAKPEPDVPRFRFRVQSKTEDTVPPKLKSFGLSPTSVGVGDTVSVWLEVQNDLSKVISAQAILAGPKGNSSLYFLTTYNPANKRFEGRLTVPASAEPGAWKVSRVTLTDGAGNPSVVLGSDNRLKNYTLNVTNSSRDGKGPELKSASFSQKSVKAGEFIVLVLQAEDKDSGISSIRVGVQPTQGGVSVSGEAFYHPGNKRWEAHLYIPRTAQNGVWEVSQVSLDDNADNGTYLNNTSPSLKGVTFSVSGGKPPTGSGTDKTPPEIKGIWLDPLSIQAGEVIRILVDAQDRESGVSRGRATFLNPRGASSTYVDLRYNAALDLWEGSRKFSLYSMDGYWRLGSLQFFDKEGNQKKLTSKDIAKLPSLTLQRTGQFKSHLRLGITKPTKAPDRSPPLIKSLQVFPDKAKAGETIRVYAQLEDPGGSGLSQGSCTIQSPSPGKSARVSFEYNSDTGYFEGNLTFPSSAAAGKWWISGCYLTDNAGNSASIPGWEIAALKPLDLTRVTSATVTDAYQVTVTSTAPAPNDTTPPSITGFHLAPGVVQAGTSIRFFVAAGDGSGSGVASGKCSFRANRGAQGGYASESTVTLRWNPATTFWEGNLSIDSDEMAGEWTIQSCVFADKAGNQKKWSATSLALLPALSLKGLAVSAASDHRVFAVKANAPSTDKTPPVFEGIAIHPPNALPGQSARVYVKASDNVGVSRVSCSFKPSWKDGPFAYYRSVFLSFNPRSGFWEGNISIPYLSHDGFWSISRCDVQDKAGNEYRVQELEMGKSKALDLTSYLARSLTKKTTLQVQSGGSGQTDTTAPVITSVRWLPSTPRKAGQSALLQVKATDSDSGVSSASLTLQSPKGGFSDYKTLQWNPATQAWETIITFPLYGEDGDWGVQDVSVQDRAGNGKTLVSGDALLKNVLLKISGSKVHPDQKPPTIQSVTLGTRVLQAGQSTRVIAQLSDDVSGIGRATVQFYSPNRIAQSSASLSWNPTTKRYEGELKIPLKGEDGLWKAVAMSVRDRVSRQTTLKATDALLSKVQLTVRNSQKQTDTFAPELKALELFPGTLKPGGLLRLFADITDAGGSGIASVSFQLQDAKSGERLWVTPRFNPSTGWYEGSARISPTAAAGTWKVIKADMSDKAGNSRSLTDKDPPLK